MPSAGTPLGKGKEWVSLKVPEVWNLSRAMLQVGNKPLFTARCHRNKTLIAQLVARHETLTARSHNGVICDTSASPVGCNFANLNGQEALHPDLGTVFDVLDRLQLLHARTVGGSVRRVGTKIC